jgi:hypothetical protein
LDTAQVSELKSLLDNEHQIDSDAMDLAAAAATVHWIQDQIMPMPEHVSSKVLNRYHQDFC